MRIGPRLSLHVVLIASFAVITTALLIGFMSFNYGQHILEEQARDRLTLVRDIRSEYVRHYLQAIMKQVLIFSDNTTVIDAMKDLDRGFSTYAQEVKIKGLDQYKDTVIKKYISEFSRDYSEDNGGIPFDATPYLNLSNASTFALQYNYIFSNPYGIDKESRLLYIDDGSEYSKSHSKYHEHLRQLKELFGFEDIFLVDSSNGDIIYTVAKGLDFTTSLISGPYASTALGDAFRRANSSDGTKRVIVSDFEAYAPSNDDQAAFIATPIYDQGKKVGILIFQLSTSVLDQIMTSDKRWQQVGLGLTGESYLIDKNHRMLTTSRAFVEDPNDYLILMNKLGLSADAITRMQARNNNNGWQTVNTEAADAVSAGDSGFGVYKNYRGVEVLGSYAPLNMADVNWGIVVEIDEQEAFAPVYDLAVKMLINLTWVMLLIILFAVLAGVSLSRQISGPIERFSAKVRMLSDTQDLTQRIDFPANDELGDMAVAINKLIESFQSTCQETILSTQKVRNTASRLLHLADEIDSQESMHKFEDNYGTVHSKTEEIKVAGDNLEELSARLHMLSRQFKVFEENTERAKDW